MSAPVWVKLLVQLRKRRARPVLPDTIARALDITPTVLRREITLLTQRGHEIVADKRGRLTLSAEGPLSAQELQSSVRGHLVCRSIQVHRELASTQDAIRKEAGGTDVGGVVVFAERQRRGRGRFGRTWLSAAGENLLFSILLRFPHVEASPSVVTVTASVALCECLFGWMNLPAQIRWPNDILLAGRKVAGILVERTRPRGRPPAYIVGIGLNVNSAPKLETATSIRDITGSAVDRTPLASELLRRLQDWYQLVDDGHDDEVAEHWRRHSSTLGRRITLMSRRRRFSGRVLDMSPAEGLTIQLDNSLPMTFRPEEATLVP